jgi:hypothetical protein
MNCDVKDWHFELPAFVCVEDVYYLVYVAQIYMGLSLKFLNAFEK